MSRPRTYLRKLTLLGMKSCKAVSFFLCNCYHTGSVNTLLTITECKQANLRARPKCAEEKDSGELKRSARLREQKRDVAPEAQAQITHGHKETTGPTRERMHQTHSHLLFFLSKWQRPSYQLYFFKPKLNITYLNNRQNLLSSQHSCTRKTSSIYIKREMYYH